jgi:anti-anti-sigma factor
MEGPVNLPITSVRLLDGTIQISVRGDIDLDNAYLIREAVDRALAGQRTRGIVVDLAHVEMIDSMGIGTLVACFHAAAASGVRLRLTHPSTIVYRQLWVSGLVGLFGLPTPSADGGRRAAAAR